VKPNVVSGSPPPTTTDPRVVHSYGAGQSRGGRPARGRVTCRRAVAPEPRPHSCRPGSPASPRVGRDAPPRRGLIGSRCVRPRRVRDERVRRETVHEVGTTDQRAGEQRSETPSFSCALEHRSVLHGKNKPWAVSGGRRLEPVWRSSTWAVATPICTSWMSPEHGVRRSVVRPRASEQRDPRQRHPSRWMSWMARFPEGRGRWDSVTGGRLAQRQNPARRTLGLGRVAADVRSWRGPGSSR